MSELWLVGTLALASLLQSPAPPEGAPRPRGEDVARPQHAIPRGRPMATVKTALGEFTILLAPDLAPNHVKLFVETAQKGGYDGTLIHRVIPNAIIQGGDPLTKDPGAESRYGSGGLGLVKAEFSATPFKRGIVAAARRPGENDSGGTQFFVVVADQSSLNGQYTVFGEVTRGMDVVDSISRTPATRDRPLTRVPILKVTIEEQVLSAQP